MCYHHNMHFTVNMIYSYPLKVLQYFTGDPSCQ